MPRQLVPTGGAFLLEAPDGPISTPEVLDSDAVLMADAAADFMRGQLLPAADRLQEREPGLMAALLRAAGGLGLMGLEVPAEYGGLGLSTSAATRIAEAVAIEPSFAVSHNVHTSVATLPLVLFGTEEQRAQFLPRMAAGEQIGAYALSEANAASDALSARTRALPVAGGYELSGEKMWTTNAAFADLFIAFATVPEAGLTAFVVERGAPGITIGREEHKLGIKGSSTCRVAFDAVRVPEAAVIGAPGEGARIALLTLNLGRLKIAASAVGQSKRLLALATAYAVERHAFGRPIAEFGLIQEKLARMAARVFAAESMLYRVAGCIDAFADQRTTLNHEDAKTRSRHEAGLRPASGATGVASPNTEHRTPNTEHHTPNTEHRTPNAEHRTPNTEHPKAAASDEYAIECALIKVACTETLDYCADECLQIHGGYGYVDDYPAARAWRDARVTRIYEGTSEINRLAAGGLLMKRIGTGRIDLSRAPSLADPEPATPHAMRAVFAHLVRTAAEQSDDIDGRQQILAALSDSMIALLADECAALRAARIVESGAPESRFAPAFTARRLLLPGTLAAIRERAQAVLAECGEVEPTEAARIGRLLDAHDGRPFEAARDLAAAVVAAGGYPWS